MSQKGRPAADAGISIGQVFLGKYRVDAVLGYGGMGVVTKCTHLGLNDPVAMKMLRQDVMLDHDATERFQREAQAASKLRSEHVARVVDVGKLHESGVPYMVMEYLEGNDLGEMLDQRESLPFPLATLLMMQAAEALTEAHSIGIVHRDVKPTNLFITWRPDGSMTLKVLDFGISKSPVGTDMQLTQTQSLLGTPAYMSPEQMRSARLVDARTDIWSLGIVFYELLEGHRPFEAESFSEMCVKVAVDQPVAMTKTPPALQQVVLRCLAKSPDQRYANMAELGRDLLPFVDEANQGQAQMLVKRMAGIQGRRSNVDFSNQATPVPWHTDSQPLGTPAPWYPEPESGISRRAPTPGVGLPQMTMNEPGTLSDRLPSEFSGQPKHRRSWPMVLAAAIVVGGFGLAAYILAKGDTDSAPPNWVVDAMKRRVTPELKSSAIVVDHKPDKPDIKNPVDPGVKSPVDPPHKTTATGSAVDHEKIVIEPKPIIKKPRKWLPIKKDPPKEMKKDPPKEVKPPAVPKKCPAEKIAPSGKCTDPAFR